ncbi:MAG: hypothetical protein AAF986_11630 [Pseudomonadota bacterium]
MLVFAWQAKNAWGDQKRESLYVEEVHIFLSIRASLPKVYAVFGKTMRPVKNLKQAGDADLTKPALDDVGDAFAEALTSTAIVVFAFSSERLRDE